MNERLLQFIWQFRYFNQSGLSTTDGKPLQIIHPGMLNRNSGPDFSEARIKIAGTTWVGNIELHVQASHWYQHKHELDKNYNNVILHVVWINDKEVLDDIHQPIATLEMQSLVPKITLQRFEHLMQTADPIPCASALPALSEVSWLSWKERLIAERLQEKSNLIMHWLKESNNNWEEVFWISLCRSFGMRVNAEVFEQIAMTVTVNLLAKHKGQIHQLEALLLGQAGLLHGEFEETYAIMLQKEYNFLSKKYGLSPVKKQPAFLRMRPSNFPTLRMAQLAMLVYQSNHLFSTIKSANKLNEFFQWFDVTANDFWTYHYTLNDAAVYRPKAMGNSFIRHIIINTIVPVLFAYGVNKNDGAWKDRSLNFLMEIEPEENVITKQWQAYGVANKNALESQALIHLKNNYCDKKLCLDCAVGVKLLRTS
ncbi:MAG TPA: DUF2851 family protein [Parafilimonas sp.]|nr:DUF2851 family protein [Parafilimonas sp.]